MENKSIVQSLNNNKVLLSIIVPVYNVEEYLGECIESLLNQELDSWEFEIILVNDGSTDSSKSICDYYSNRFFNIRLINQDNKGLSGARNSGIAASVGEYLYFIDSDDYLVKKSFRVFLDYIILNNLDFFGFNIERTSNRNFDKIYDGKLDIIVEGSGLDILNNFNFNNGVWWYIFKADILKQLRFVPERFCEDGIFTPRLLMEATKAVIISSPIYQYYFNSASIVNNRNKEKNMKIIDDMFFVVNEFDEILNALPKNNLSAFNWLRFRQETYVYFGVVRYLKLQLPFRELNEKLNSLNFENYSVYPMKSFTGYDRRDKYLLLLINQKWSLHLLNLTNQMFKVIK